MADPGERSTLTRIREKAQVTGYVLIGLLLGGQALLGTVLQAGDAADPVGLFISVLLFTWPLSLAVAIGIVGFARYPAVRAGWFAPLVFIAILAAGALALADTLGGVVIEPTSATANGSGPYALLAFTISIIGGFMNAYGPLVFVGALVVGGALAWIWLEDIDPQPA
jgi:hypothetical protein